mmetsp:Transcript_4481/g.6646  ORF Transcript_4481/g.6646 Transcript_4481/m.6646 type:complete len:80 (-) Transcript_4481:5-244(-)
MLIVALFIDKQSRGATLSLSHSHTLPWSLAHLQGTMKEKDIAVVPRKCIWVATVKREGAWLFIWLFICKVDGGNDDGFP